MIYPQPSLEQWRTLNLVEDGLASNLTPDFGVLIALEIFCPLLNFIVLLNVIMFNIPNFQRIKELLMVNEIGKEFMEKTKYHYLDKSDQMKGLPQPSLELEYDKTKTVIDLPGPEDIKVSNISLREAIENRRSMRKYSQIPLTIEELSYLLWCTQGVKEVMPRSATLRTVPSAGARHAFEPYLLVNNVKDLEGGIYRFLAIEHKLVEINTASGIADQMTEACFGQIFVKTSAVTFIWTAVPYRMNWRYGQRGYRYMHLDAGHVCQNLYLSAASIDCGVCAIAAFSDDDMNRLLNLDGENQFVIYIATAGKK